MLLVTRPFGQLSRVRTPAPADTGRYQDGAARLPGMDTTKLRELVPHYVVMLLIVFLVLAGVRSVVGELSFWGELAIIIGIVFLYRPVVKRMGIAPSVWEDR